MKTTAISILIASALIVGAIILTGNSRNASSRNGDSDNVTVLADKQIIEINAKGGYFPKVTNAKSNLPTTLKIKTNGTFDCSSALLIPSAGFRKNLPPSGITEIELPVQKSGSILRGLCGMGMYGFQVRFD